MRALLVVNHRATTTSRRSRDVLIRALHSVADLRVEYTHYRGHATSLAAAAVGEAELLVVHGGDGTVNEVVNGLAPAPYEAAHRPVLAVVPGGSTNVFARALGLPNDWVEATGAILEAVRAQRQRTIGLGRANDRFFTFCAGMGLDAAVVRRVEQARRRGRGSSPVLYARAAAVEFAMAGGRPPPDITLAPGATAGHGADDEDATDDGQPDLATVIVQNTAPWTYLGRYPVDPNPDCSFERGLDVLAMSRLGVPSAARTFGGMLRHGRVPQGRHVRRWHDLDAVALHGNAPQPVQADGDYLGKRTELRLASVPACLRVCC